MIRPVNLFRISSLQYAAITVASGLFLVSLLIVTRMLTSDTPRFDNVAREFSVLMPPLPIIIHLLTVIPAIPLGIFVLLRRKGDWGHKTAGYIWVTLMMITAVTTLFIHQVNPDGLSPIHIFSFMTLFGLPLAIFRATQGDIARHKRGILGVFIGGLCIAGLFSFLPGRLMHFWLMG